jgi:hypothetical protein
VICVFTFSFLSHPKTNKSENRMTMFFMQVVFTLNIDIFFVFLTIYAWFAKLPLKPHKPFLYC